MIAEESEDKRRSRLAAQARRMQQRLFKNETEEDCHKKNARWERSKKDHSLIHVLMWMTTQLHLKR